MKLEQKFSRSALALAISLLFPVSTVLADELDGLLNPNAKDLVFGAVHLDKVNPIFRQYYGINNTGLNGFVDFNFVERNPEGRWYRVDAYNLGLSTQEISASVEKQGDWSVALSYDQIPRYAPFVVSSPNQGIGGINITLPNATELNTPSIDPINTALGNNTKWANYKVDDLVRSYDLKTERTATSLSVTKFVTDHLRTGFSFKSEEKTGARMFGMGERVSPSSPAAAFMYFTPEPIDSTHQQFEASMEYYSKVLQVSAGYYGSFYDNNAGGSLDVITSNPAVLPLNSSSKKYVVGNTALALSPSNYLNQFYLSGAYNYSQDTRLNFKASHSMGVQNSEFMGGVTNISGRTNLGAEVDTTNLFASITSRLAKNTTFLASWSREDRDDKTPLVNYIATSTNNPESTVKEFAKLELAQGLPFGYKATFGIDYDQRKFKGLYADGLRENIDEATYRVDLRKNLSETLNGKVLFSHAERNGSDWLSPTGAAGLPSGVYYAGSIQFSDRIRDKVKFVADWNPVESLNLQASYEMSDDEYDNRSPNNGTKSGHAKLYSFDAAYQLNDYWSFGAWYSNSISRVSYVKLSANPTVATPNPAVSWSGKAELDGNALGADIKGKVFRTVDVGLQYVYSRDTGKYPMAWAAANATPIGVPDTSYSLERFRVYGKYPIAKNTVIRADFVYDVRKMDDYTWGNWVFSDGTRVFVDPKQTSQVLFFSLMQSF